MNQQQYTTIIAIGAKLLATFDSTMAKAQARLKGLQKTAETVASKLGFLKTALSAALSSLGAFAVGAVFKRIFDKAFEEAAAAQERVLAVTNEFWIHMQKEGRDAAMQQTLALFAYNKELAKTGVISHQIYDTLVVGLSKIGEGPREIAEVLPVLADVLVRAKGIRASTEDASELADTIVRVAKGGRQIQLLKWGILLGPSERARLKAYKDDWRGALDYLFHFLKTYKGFNEEAARTPLGQIQRMKNLFDELSETIGTTMLPAEADMAAAWEKALPVIQPVILEALKDIARVITFIANEVGAFYERVAMPDAVAALAEVNKAFHELLDTLGIELPEAGIFGRIFGAAFIASCKLIAWQIHNIELVVKALGWVFNFVFGDAIKSFHRMSDELNRLGKIWALVKAWVTEALAHPIDFAYHRLLDLLALLHIIKKPSKQTVEALTGVPVNAQGLPTEMPPIPEKYAKNAALREAYMKGAAPPVVPKGGYGKTPAYALPGGYGYGPQRPPPPPAYTAPPPPTGRPPAIPAMPSTRIWTPSGAPYGAVGGPGFIPPGATMPYGRPPYVPPTPPPTGGVGGAGAGAGAMPPAPFGGMEGAKPIPLPPSGGVGGGGAAAGSVPIAPGGGGGGAPAGVAGAGVAPPSAPLSEAGLAAVVAERAPFIAQMRQPETMKLIAATLATEAGSASDQATVLEALVNRAAAYAAAGHPKSIQELITGGFYGPWNRGETQRKMAAGITPERMAQVAAIIDSIAAGQNRLRGMTDQGMKNEIKGYKEKVGEDYYGFMGIAGERQTAAYRQSQAAGQAPPPMLAANAYALGGIAKMPQLAMLAEKGPEMVLPMVGRGALGLFGSLLGGLRDMTGGGDTHHYNFSPNVTISGNADQRTVNEMDIKLRNLAREFINSFKEAQRQERRLSYESGYSS